MFGPVQSMGKTIIHIGNRHLSQDYDTTNFYHSPHYCNVENNLCHQVQQMEFISCFPSIFSGRKNTVASHQPVLNLSTRYFSNSFMSSFFKFVLIMNYIDDDLTSRPYGFCLIIWGLICRNQGHGFYHLQFQHYTMGDEVL